MHVYIDLRDLGHNSAKAVVYVTNKNRKINE